jgi:hypothetical protein
VADASDDYTPIFNAIPCVMFVGLGDDAAKVCAQGCEPMKILKVAHAAAALPRMVTTHPLLVILGASVPPAGEEEIRQHALALGTEVLPVSQLDAAAPVEQLKSLVRQALLARSLRSM